MPGVQEQAVSVPNIQGYLVEAEGEIVTCLLMVWWR